jgi:50S ribosomal protein L16 3-hydroxylase
LQLIRRALAPISIDTTFSCCKGLGGESGVLGLTAMTATPQLQENGLSLILLSNLLQTYVLEPGDVLYVPPGVAHWGVALGEAITYSLGFRSPPVADLMARRTDATLELISTTSLLEDAASTQSPARPGEITAEHIANARDAINNAIDALDSGQWFGEVITEGSGERDQTHEPTVLLSDQVRLHPAARIAWLAREESIDLFIDGAHFEVPLALVDKLIAVCSGDWVTRRELAEEAETLYEHLCETGALTDEGFT